MNENIHFIFNKKGYGEENWQLRQRIHKAIEYIENHSLYHEEYSDDWDEENYLVGITDEKESKELLDILKGSDSNE